MSNRAVFFDRDDTLMKDVPYSGDPDRVKLMPGAQETLITLQRCGYLLFIVSNQSGVGRGLITPAQVESVNEELLRQLGDGLITKIYTCFAAPGDDPENCRKPKPAMILQAQKEFNLDLSRCYLVGDKPADILCARNAGCKSVLVLTGSHGEPIENVRCDFIAGNLTQACAWICKDRALDDLSPNHPER